MNDEERNYWRKVLTHEAGHAVAALVVLQKVADIVVRAGSSEQHQYAASYALPDSQKDVLSGKTSPLKQAIIYAAGGKAEQICLGISNSAGFAGDMQKIISLRDWWSRRCRPDRLDSMKLPDDAKQHALGQIPRLKEQLLEIQQEIESDYGQTKQIIAQYRDAVESLAHDALSNLSAMPESDIRPGTIILSRHAIRSMWKARTGLLVD